MAVYVHLADGFEEIEALTSIDLLRRVGVPVESVSIMGRLNVTGVHGIEVIADIVFSDADYDSCEMIVLPGGLPGAENLAGHDGLKQKLLSFANKGRRIAAICASPNFVLAPLGIVDGRKATGYPGVDDNMDKALATDGAVVKDDNIITSRGPATAMPFALALVEELRGKDVRERLAKELLYDQ
ncbi:MAG: DJ-1/PfpI family protein [Clostridiales Family XIII bacterium]|jgi:4-methyl-5(b-hydroxyethyl)-thiazole monophosphate biosynthesis|nr:DJ-1/PfpI family protein [Clostridiales Family XIII bacterium]